MPGSVSVTGRVEQAPEQDAVDDQREVGDDTEKAVVDEQVEQHQGNR